MGQAQAGRVRPFCAIIALLVVALGLRLAWLAADPHPAADAGMAGGYLDMARTGPGANALILPGIPAVVAAVWRITGQYQLPLLVLMVLLDVLNVWLLYVVGRRWFGSAAGVIAAGAYAVFPVAVDYAHTLTDGTPTVTGVLLILLVCTRARTRAWWRTALLLALVGGLGAYVRTNLLLFAVAAAAGLPPLLGWRRAGRIVLVTAVAGYALFLPWVIRDAVELHAFLPLGRTGTGQTMYEGLVARPSDALTFSAAQRAGFTGSYGTVAYDAYLSRLYQATPTSDKLVAAERHLIESLYPIPRGTYGPLLDTLAFRMGAAMALLALGGLLLLRSPARAVLLTVGLTVWLSQVPFLTSPRFALAVVPVHAVLAAAVLVRAWSLRSERRTATVPQASI